MRQQKSIDERKKRGGSKGVCCPLWKYLEPSQGSPAATNLSVTPLPFSTQATVTFTASEKGNAAVRIVNTMGISCQEITQPVTEGRATLKRSGLDKLPAGNYFLSVTLNGTVIGHQHVVKQ